MLEILEINKIFKKYLTPFYKKYGFKYKKIGKEEYIYKNTDRPEAMVHYILYPQLYYLETKIFGGPGRRFPINLICFIDGPDNFCPFNSVLPWFFNNYNELLGALEKQSELLEEWVFDWMLEKKYKDKDFIREFMEYSQKHSPDGIHRDKESKEKLILVYKQWRSRRFYPKKWVLEDLNN